MTRREMIAGAVGSTIAGGRASSLAEIARRAGRTFGCAASLKSLDADPALSAAVDREARSITPEIELKWAALSPSPGVLDFSRLDALAAWARARGKRMRGHTLLWRRSVPAWVAAELRGKADWLLVEQLMGSVMPRFGDVADTWDVVNEPLAPIDGSADVFATAYGPDYIQRALETARRFAPKAKLSINEFALEYTSAEHRDRRTALLRLVETLKTAGAPLDQVGLQSHLDLTKGPLDEQGLLALIDGLAGMGVSVEITELDVKEANYIASPDVRDAAVADETRRYLDIVLSRPAVIGVSTWGLSDRASWLQVTDEDRRRFPGAWRDGSSPGANRGLPLGADLLPKPMRAAIAQALAKASNHSF